MSIQEAVFAAIKQECDAEPPREYLGASSIGRECDREIWYSFRHGDTTTQFNGRVYRLFEHGNMEEERIVRDLRRAGYKVIDKKPNGEQYGFEHGFFRGHIDGVIFIDGEPCLLECKTASAKQFEAMQSKGIKEAKPEYYAQAQVYMKHVKGKTDLRKAVFFVVNKDNDDIYTEMIDYSEVDAGRYTLRAESIIGTTHNASASPGWKCGWCAFKNMCQAHKKEREAGVPAVPVRRKTCRQCVYAELDGDEWRCKHHGTSLSFDDQLKACKQHTFLPDFIGFATPIGAKGIAGIEYKRPDGETFVQGPKGIDSDAMMFYGQELISMDNAEELVKRMFGGEVLSREQPPF